MRSFLVFIVTALTLVTAAAAQDRPRNWVVSGEVGLLWRLPEAFETSSWGLGFEEPSHGPTSDTCRARTVERLGVGLGRRINQWLHLAGVLSLQANPGTGCVSPAIPIQNVLLGQYVGRTVGNDYLSTEFRAVVEPGSANARPRGVLGLGWIPKKQVPFIGIGGGISAGRQGARFVSELGAHISRVRWEREFRCYGSCGSRTGMQWSEKGADTSLQPYVRIGVEF